ncbi:MAG TPA: DUF5985 family protein [Acidobacteriaceae bacterium]|nr:DUF5985 family protein [Acidobacteriaceae bacterium]
MMTAVLVLTFLTMLLCAVLQLRAYFDVRRGLLLWSGLCFLGLSISNLLVIADLEMFPTIDFYTWRIGSAAAAMVLLLYGLIWESR